MHAATENRNLGRVRVVDEHFDDISSLLAKSEREKISKSIFLPVGLHHAASRN